MYEHKHADIDVSVGYHPFLCMLRFIYLQQSPLLLRILQPEKVAAGAQSATPQWMVIPVIKLIVIPISMSIKRIKRKHNNMNYSTC